MTAGLTPTGFVSKTVEEIVADMEAAERSSALGTDVDTSGESLVGAFNAVVGTQLGELWELARIVYESRAPRAASFTALDDVAAITGSDRRGATNGLGRVNLSLNAGITVPAGRRVSALGDPSNLWQTTVAATNPSGSPAVVPVQVQCVAAGRVLANAGILTVIATPIAGWTGVTNPEDCVPGLPLEGDPAFRARRTAELFRPGTSPVDSIYADLADVAVNGVGVVASLSVEENASAYYDALHRPPHTVEAVVQFTPGLAGADLTAARQALAVQLFASKAGGIDTVGSLSTSVVDANGVPRTVRWNEPTLIPVWFTLVLSIDPVKYDASSSFAATKAIVIAYGTALRLGRDVIRNGLVSLLMEQPGVIDVIELRIGATIIGQREANLSIGPRELASFDTSRITVTTEIASEP